MELTVAKNAHGKTSLTEKLKEETNILDKIQTSESDVRKSDRVEIMTTKEWSQWQKLCGQNQIGTQKNN